MQGCRRRWGEFFLKRSIWIGRNKILLHVFNNGLDWGRNPGLNAAIVAARKENVSYRVECQRFYGVPKGCDLGTLESYAALLGILIGAGIFKVTSDAWALTGPSVILGYLVLAIPVLATSIAYSVFLSTPLGREPGGEYAHISRTFGGYGLAFVGVWLKIISYVGALAYLSRAFADYVVELFGGGAILPIAIGGILFFYAIHVAGVRWFHLSNASLAGPSRNPDIEALGLHAGILLPF